MNVKADLQSGNMSRVIDVIYYQMGFFSIFISCERNVLLGGEGGERGKGCGRDCGYSLNCSKIIFPS